MILYYFEACPFCQKVLRKIDELHLSDQIEFRDTMKNPEYRDDLMKLNGNTQVPCLVMDGKPMLESNDINEYLQQTYG